MNQLTVNLHLMMVSFYRPVQGRFKIIMEASSFPSDRYAVESQIKFHGFDPAEALIEIYLRLNFMGLIPRKH
jgi:kynureninase